MFIACSSVLQMQHTFKVGLLGKRGQDFCTLNTWVEEDISTSVAWRRLSRAPWTARRTHLSILKVINPKCSLEGQILKLRFQYFGHLMRKEDSLENTLMLGKSEGKRRRGHQRMRWLDSVIEATNMNLTQVWEAVEGLSLIHI